MVGKCSNATHCNHASEGITLETFEYKGCWNCRWFSRKEGAYMTVKEASEKYNVSESTIRCWCKSGKLKAYLCKKRRYTGNFFQGPPKIWVISREGNIEE